MKQEKGRAFKLFNIKMCKLNVHIIEKKIVFNRR